MFVLVREKEAKRERMRGGHPFQSTQVHYPHGHVCVQIDACAYEAPCRSVLSPLFVFSPPNRRARNIDGGSNNAHPWCCESGKIRRP